MAFNSLFSSTFDQNNLNNAATNNLLTNGLSVQRSATPAPAGTSGFRSRTSTPGSAATATGANPTTAIDTILANKTAKFKFPSDTPKYYTEFSLNDVSVTGTLTEANSVILPLPLELVDGNHVRYHDFPLSGTTVLSGAAAALGSTLAGTGLGKIIGGGVGAGAVQAAGIISQTLGYTPAEFMTVLFDGPQFKRFQMKFKLSPKNYQESLQIRHIINAFNNAMAPGLAAGGFLWSFPDVIEIAFQPNPGWLFKFKPAVLEAFMVNYSAGGRPAFYRDPGNGDLTPGTNNPPDSVDLQMHFIEIEYWRAGQFHETNDPSDGYKTGLQN